MARGWAESGTHAADAVKMLQGERALRPNMQVEVALGWAQLRAGALEAATATSARALKVGPGDVRLSALVAELKAAQGDRRAALTALDGLAPRLAVLAPSLRTELETQRTTLTEQLAAR